MDTVDLNRFNSKIKRSNGCWEWIGTKRFDGYGVITINRIMQRAHRVMWEIANGKITKDICVLHKCDNPICVNPQHLFLGTRKDNAVDCARKGRNIAQKEPWRMARGERNGRHTHPETTQRGERHWASKLSKDKVILIRKLYKPGKGLYVRSNAKELSKRFGISKSVFYNIIKRKIWKHVISN